MNLAKTLFYFYFTFIDCKKYIKSDRFMVIGYTGINRRYRKPKITILNPIFRIFCVFCI